MGSLFACGTPADVPPDPAEVLVRLETAPAAICPMGGVEALSGIDANDDGTLADDEASARGWSCHDTAVVLTSEPTADGECSGQRIATGIDANGDGILSADERHAETTVCDGAAPALTRVTRAALSEICPVGGFRVEHGTDSDGNEALSDDEVAGDELLCFFEVRNRIEDAGSACVAGGVRVESGADLDGDGALAPHEVTASVLACGDTLDSDIYLRSAEDVARASELRHILGTVHIVPEDGHLDVALAELETAGAIQVRCPEAPGCSVALALPQLEEIEGMLYIGGVSLSALSLPALREVEGTLSIVGASLSALSLPALQRVGALTLGSSSGMQSLSLPALTHADTLHIASMPDLATIALRGFGRLPVEVNIRANPALSSLELAAAAPSDTVRRPSMWIEANEALERVHLALYATDFPRLLNMVDNVALTELRIEGASSFDAIKVWRSPLLEDLSFGERASPLRVGSLHVLAPVRALTSVDVEEDLWLVESQVTSVELGAVRRVSVDRNVNLRSVHAADVDEWVVARDNALLEEIVIDTPVIGVDGVDLENNPNLSRAPWLAELGFVSRTLSVRGNPILSLPQRWDLVFQTPAQISLEGASVQELRIRAEELSQLRLVGTSLRSVVASSLRGDRFAAEIEVVGNPELTSLSLTGDFGAFGTLAIDENPILSQLALSAPTYADSITITDNASLPACLAEDLLARIETEDGELQSGNDPAATCP